MKLRWSNVWVIFRREVRDQVRDRRTMFMIFVLPVLLYPMLVLGVVSLRSAFEQKPQAVVVVGAERLPDEPPLLSKSRDRFDESLYDADSPGAGRLVVRVEPSDSQWRNRGYARVEIRNRIADAVILVPEDIRERIAGQRSVELAMYADQSDERSELAARRTREVIDRWTSLILGRRAEAVLKKADARVNAKEFLAPVKTREVNVATDKETGGGPWALILPFLLVMMSLTGAFYPAIDLCAGEKERGTMETLLISPASRYEIVLGKFLTVVLASMSMAVLNLASMGLTGLAVARQFVALGRDGGGSMALEPPRLVPMLWTVLLLVPLSAFFSAICVALAVMAKSMKEGQYYLTPLYMVALPLIFLTLSPAIELDLPHSFVPITGVSLLLRALMEGKYGLARQYFLPVLVPTTIYGAIALRWAVDQFMREDVLFREAERFDLRAWLRHVVRDRGPTPTAGEALFCFALMLTVALFLSGFLQGSPTGLVVGQVGFVMAPPVLLALILTRSPARTLRLRWPAARFLAVAAALAVTLHPLMVELGRAVEYAFPVPRLVQDYLQTFISKIPDLGTMVVLIAVVPAICEEFAFRGFILSGLENGHRPRSAIVVSAFLFGIMHVLVSVFGQLFGTTVLGLVLGLLAVRSRSLLPGIVFHFGNNALGVLAGHAAEVHDRYPALRGLYRDPACRYYHWHWVALGALASAALLTWLYRDGKLAATGRNDLADPVGLLDGPPLLPPGRDPG
jgi:sodium transport system permease protein